MAITPQTNLFLLKCPIKLDNKNQVTFSDATSQRNYFLSLPKIEVEKFSYQRRDSVIRFPAHIDSIQEFNYCMYQNSNYTNKWFYAFITSMQYVNDNLTLISITTDVFQTWQFNLQYKECFIEREHINVSEDGIGANLIPEGLETGEFIENASSTINGLNQVYVIAFAKDPVLNDLTTGTSIYNGCILNNIASGLWYCICSADQCLTQLKQIDLKGLGNDVISVYTIPAIAVSGALPNVSDTQLFDINSSFASWILNYQTSPGRDVTLQAIPNSLDGYVPRNQKLRQYPYMYLGFIPTTGNKTIYRYENFQDGIPSFKLISEVNPNPNVYFVPKNYNGVSGENVSESAILSGYPSVSYHTDYYSNWIAQNQNLINLSLDQNAFNYVVKQGQNALNEVNTTMNSLDQIFSGHVVGGAGSFVTGSAQNALNAYSDSVNYDYSIKNQMAQIEQQKLLPNSGSTGGSNATLLSYGLFNDDIFTRYTIKRQFAERIDKYFDMFGYLTNKIKVPNIFGRPTWNYVKTIGAIIEGDVPQGDLELIKQFFNNGITLWHNTSNFLNYSVNNR